MILNKFYYTTPPLLLLSAVGTLIFTSNYLRGKKSNGLSAVAASDSIATLISSVVMSVCMMKTQRTCDSTDIFLQYTMIFFPFINGFISQVLWNHQCCIEIKTDKRSTEGKSTAMKVVISNFVPSLFLLPLLLTNPQELALRSNEDKRQCRANILLSSTHVEKCEDITFRNNELFNKFLLDFNKSHYELIYSNERRDELNNTAEIVKKIYQLVGEEMNTLGYRESRPTARREPRVIIAKKTKNDSTNYAGNSDLSTTKTALKEIEDENSKSFVQLQSNTNHIESSNMSNDLKFFHLNNTNKHKPSVEEELLKNYTLIALNNGNGSTTSRPNKTVQQLVNQTDLSETNTNENENYCFTECVLQKESEKAYLMFLLVVCYLIPLFGAVIYYNKACIASIGIEENSDAIKGKYLLKCAKRMMIISVLLLSPNFFCLMLNSMLCMLLPDWIETSLFTASQIHPIARNAAAVLAIKYCATCKGGGKVHPVQDSTTKSATE